MVDERAKLPVLVLTVFGNVAVAAEPEMTSADSWETPFAGINNVTFADGVEPWTRDISHGELLRDGYNETPTIDLNNLRFLYQGRDPAVNTRYHLLPYRLGLLTVAGSSKQD